MFKAQDGTAAAAWAVAARRDREGGKTCRVQLDLGHLRIAPPTPRARRVRVRWAPANAAPRLLHVGVEDKGASPALVTKY